MGSTIEKRITNCSLTKKIIRLHSSGYTLDFYIANDDQIICTQDNSRHNFMHVIINVADQCYDVISHSFKYIHTIETPCGHKGLLMADKIYTTLSLAARQRTLGYQYVQQTAMLSLNGY